MKNRSVKLLFFINALIAIFTVVSFAFTHKLDYSEIENRYFSKFNILNIEEYLSDHIIFRNELISLKNNISIFLGKTKIRNIYIGKDDYLIPEFKSSEKKDALINVINDFSSKNNNVYVLIAPDSVLVNEDKIKLSVNDDEKNDILYLYSKLNTKNINVIDELINENKIHNNQFYKTDHHWTTFGAYTAYKKFCDVVDVEPIIPEFTEVTNDFEGTSASIAIGLSKPESIYINDNYLNVTVEYVNEKITTDSLYNFDYLSKKDKYSLFLDGNHSFIKITNNTIESNRKILLIKNSFANSFVPFIVNNYKEVYVIDLRYFKENTTEFIKRNSIDDILILYNLINLYEDMSVAYLE